MEIYQFSKVILRDSEDDPVRILYIFLTVDPSRFEIILICKINKARPMTGLSLNHFLILFYLNLFRRYRRLRNVRMIMYFLYTMIVYQCDS